MVRRFPSKGRSGWVMIEVVMALAVFIIGLVPLAYSALTEYELCRAYYYRAVALEIVDGEMEVLVAGEYRRYEPGSHPYPISAPAATNLPGRFLLTRELERLRLEWVPERKGQGGRVVREVKIP